MAWVTAANGSAVWGMLIFGPSDWIDAGAVAFTDISPDWYVSIYMDLPPPESGFVIAAASSFSAEAVPLPLPAALLGAGLLGLVALRRRA